MDKELKTLTCTSISKCDAAYTTNVNYARFSQQFAFNPEYYKAKLDAKFEKAKLKAELNKYKNESTESTEE